MSKVRVYEVARELGMKNKELVSLFQSLGFSEVRNHMSSVESEAVDRVKRRIARKEGGELVEERLTATVVKRRGRRPAPAAPSSKAGKSPAGGNAEPAKAAPVVRRKATAATGNASATAPAATAPAATASAATASAATASAAAATSASAAASATAPSAAVAPTGAAAAPVDAPSANVAADGETGGTATAKAKEPKAADATAAVAKPAASADAAQADAPATPAKPAPAAAKSTPAIAPPPTAAAQKVAATAVPAPKSPDTSAKPAAAGAAAPAAGAAATPARRTGPPKRGIEVWAGRPGVPMPVRPRTPARRTTYDPRAASTGGGGPARRSGYPQSGFRGRSNRPGFRRGPGFNRHQRRGPVQVSTKEMGAHKMIIKIDGETSLQSLAGKMSLKSTDVMMKLISMGMTGVNINSNLDTDTAKLVASEFGWTLEDVSVDEAQELKVAMEIEDETEGESIIRPPVVTVMGHVDHGKTTLLDTIRKTDVAGGEAGGITQHIGAYRVETAKGTICFLDTPGHAAFTAMRARGASVTDIVILIVAADDGPMPQTKEAAAHAQEAGVPIIVAINKCDKPGVDVEKVMREMASLGLQPEEWGGDTIFCKVSAKNGDGVDNLLDMVLLQSEVLELIAHPERRASGVVVEALLDRGRGPVARVLVKNGTLRRGDAILCGKAQGKVRAMVDEKGRMVKEAGPSTPVEVLGLSDVPEAGDPVHAVKSLKMAETIAEERKRKESRANPMLDARIASLDDLTSRLNSAEQLDLKVIVKGDVQGSVEALVQTLAKLTTERVKLTVVHTGVGSITESDVNLAVAAKGIILGFNVRPAGKAAKLADKEGVEIRPYSIIYECIDDVRSAMEGLLPATPVEKELGRAEIRQTFRISKVGTIAGCMVLSGKIRRNALARLYRGEEVIWSGKLENLKRFKDDAKEVREGFECGVSFAGALEIQDLDQIQSYEIEMVKATL